MFVEDSDGLIDLTARQALYQAMQKILLCPEDYESAKMENTLIDTMDEIVHSLSGRKVLVYAWYNNSIEKLVKHYAHLKPAVLNGTVTGANREANKQRFINDPECLMLIANPKSGGVGVDGLQHVCSHVIYAEVCPFVGTFKQSIDRLHRTGQKDSSVNSKKSRRRYLKLQKM